MRVNRLFIEDLSTSKQANVSEKLLKAKTGWSKRQSLCQLSRLRAIRVGYVDLHIREFASDESKFLSVGRPPREFRPYAWHQATDIGPISLHHEDAFLTFPVPV